VRSLRVERGLHQLGWSFVPLVRATTFTVFAIAACSRPYARMGPAVGLPGRVLVEGRVLEPEDEDPTVPRTCLSEPELENVRLEWTTDGGQSGRTRADGEGWFRIRLPRTLPPGRHAIHVRDSTKRRLGTTFATVLDPEGTPRIVRSDVDMTYLETRFGSAGEILGLLGHPASKHAPLPGMPEIYRRLRAQALTFLSGSPEFFRAHLQGRLAIDRIRFDALRLKPMGRIVAAKLAMAAPGEIEGALREQVGYKLRALLEDRLDFPRAAIEVLLGDDSEMDPFAYHLYREAASGRMNTAGLRNELTALGVEQDVVASCLRLLPPVRRHLGERETVAAIFIRRTDRPNAHHPSAHLAEKGVRFHRDSRELSTALAEMGWLR